MNIDNNISYIKRVVTLAKGLGIDDIIFEEGRIRAMDIAQSVIILHDNQVPEFPFTALGISRANLFLSRLALIEDKERATVEFTASDDGNVKLLTMKAKGGKAEFRTPNVGTLRAPKRINDNMTYRFVFDLDAMNVLTKASAAMPQNKEDAVITFIGNEHGIEINITDKSNEVFSWVITEGFDTLVDDAPISFANRYPLAETLALFKRIGDEVTVQIGAPNGIMKTNVNGFDVYVLPKK